MRETRADTVQAVVYAIALHLLFFAIAFLGLWWTRSAAPASAAGPVIEAELVDPDALSASMRRALARRPPPLPAAAPEPSEQETAPRQQPEPEPRPQDSPTPPQPAAQERIPQPDVVEQERVSREALAREQAQARREQEEKRRQEQVDLTERQRQEEAERKQRLSEMEQQRLKQLEDIRRQRAQAAREASLAEQKLKQLADARSSASEAAARSDAEASASPPPGNNGADSDLAAKYALALQQAIRRNWTRPDSVPLGQRCRLVIKQIPGGEVIDVQVDPSCPYDELGRRSVEAAVLKAQPLPYAGFESVFQRVLTLNFEAQDR